MYKIIRKKVAASVNSVDVPEQFEWGKWLRKPDSESLTVSKITSSLSNFKANLSFNLPETNSFNFQTKKVKLFKSKKQFSLPKEKTIKVFYKLGKSSTKKVKIFDADSGKIIFSSSYNQKSQGLDSIREIKEPVVLSNLNLIREIKEPITLSNLNLIKEVKESFALLKSKTVTTSIVFQSTKTKLKELPLVSSYPKIIEIKIEISKPASKNHYTDIDANILNQDLFEKQLFLERSISNNTIQPVFIFLNEIPSIKNFDIPNVNQLIEALDKDETSKKTNIVPIEFLNDKPQIKRIKILNSDNPKISTYSYELNKSKKTISFSNEALITNNNSTYPYLFQMDNSSILGYSFEEIFKDYSCKNWDIPLGGESIILNPEQGIEEKNISPNNDIKDEIEKVLNDDSFGEIISEILKPEIIQPDKITINDDFLYDYQREGAEFLASNKIALLCDESGLGKTYQAISALKSLLKPG